MLTDSEKIKLVDSILNKAKPVVVKQAKPKKKTRRERIAELEVYYTNLILNGPKARL